MLLGAQDKLPRLPVPELQATVTKWLRTLEPLLSAEELQRCRRLAEEFLASPVSRQLQALLDERDRREPNSWLETWWNRLAYLEYREPSVINVNFAMPFRRGAVSPSQTRRAAAVTRLALAYKRLVDDRTLPPEPQPSDQLPHTRIFNACRVPAPVCDRQERYLPNDTVVCVCRNQFWELSGAAHASVEGLERAFDRVVQQSHHSSPAVGVLTSLHRDEWTTGREMLVRLGNASSLESIQKAAFVVCLDEARPATADELFDLLLMGDAHTCSNRWFDKPLQFIFFANGEAGLNGEHSPVDGEPVARIMDWILDREEEELKSDDGSGEIVSRPIEWTLDDGLLRMIGRGRTTAAANIANLWSKQLSFQGYGKEAIVQCKLSPDAWVQAALQLAHFRLHGRFAPTYESASTRKHLAGRTETGRTLTPELARFCRVMIDSNSSTLARREALAAAAAAHVAYMREACDGRGVDRHLMALRLLAADAGVSHPFLADPAMAASSHWRLSTSQLPVRHIAVGFGPVVPDGYGVCYQIHKTRLHFAITCFRSNGETNCIALADHIGRALNDMRSLFVERAKL
jgi:carnitine O-acetyltransferase